MPDFVTVTHALLTSCLDYCNVPYMGLPLKSVRKLQLVQNVAARLLTGTDHREHVTSLLQVSLDASVLGQIQNVRYYL